MFMHQASKFNIVSVDSLLAQFIIIEELPKICRYGNSISLAMYNDAHSGRSSTLVLVLHPQPNFIERECCSFNQIQTPTPPIESAASPSKNTIGNFFVEGYQCA